MSGRLIRGDALHLPIRDESVDLIVTSPPYFGQRSYRDGGEHYDGQIGSEPTPQAFLEVLWTVTRECWRVLKPTGSMFVNLGDKRSGSGGPGTTSGLGGAPQGSRVGTRNAYVKAAFGRPKSKQLLPQRYAIGCEDGLADPEGIGWIVREELVWDKPNGMPESVRDRCRDSHEQFWHLTREGDYFAAIDEIREPYQPGTAERYAAGYGDRSATNEARIGMGYDLGGDDWSTNPLGKVPSSVWRIPTEPLIVPKEIGVDHFAAFPTEWPRRLILGFSPAGVCIACGEGRRPVTEREVEFDKARDQEHASEIARRAVARTTGSGGTARSTLNGRTAHAITGYACACPNASAPTRPAVVLDPFSGTGTVAGVARTLGRVGVGVDLSRDYLRLARWRIDHLGTRVDSRVALF